MLSTTKRKLDDVSDSNYGGEEMANFDYSGSNIANTTTLESRVEHGRGKRVKRDDGHAFSGVVSAVENAGSWLWGKVATLTSRNHSANKIDGSVENFTDDVKNSMNGHSYKWHDNSYSSSHQSRKKRFDDMDHEPGEGAFGENQIIQDADGDNNMVDLAAEEMESCRSPPFWEAVARKKAEERETLAEEVSWNPLAWRRAKNS